VRRKKLHNLEERGSEDDGFGTYSELLVTGFRFQFVRIPPQPSKTLTSCSLVSPVYGRILRHLWVNLQVNIMSPGTWEAEMFLFFTVIDEPQLVMLSR
jgi:hypothetical protein